MCGKSTMKESRVRKRKKNDKISKDTLISSQVWCWTESAVIYPGSSDLVVLIIPFLINCSSFSLSMDRSHCVLENSLT